MSFEAWTIFALFWVIFVTTPGPNALNRISNGLLCRQTDRGGVSDLAGHSRLVERGKPLWGMGLNIWVRRVMAACSSTMGFAGD